MPKEFQKLNYDSTRHRRRSPEKCKRSIVHHTETASNMARTEKHISDEAAIHERFIPDRGNKQVFSAGSREKCFLSGQTKLMKGGTQNEGKYVCEGVSSDTVRRSWARREHHIRTWKFYVMRHYLLDRIRNHSRELCV